MQQLQQSNLNILEKPSQVLGLSYSSSMLFSPTLSTSLSRISPQCHQSLCFSTAASSCLGSPCHGLWLLASLPSPQTWTGRSRGCCSSGGWLALQTSSPPTIHSGT